MTRQRRDSLAAGACLVLIGLFAAIEGSRFEFGNMMRVGPALMPVILGVVMVGLGVMVAIEEKPLEAEPLASARSMAAIFGSILAFAVLIRSAGLIPATFALVLIAGLAESKFRSVSLLATSVGLALFSYLIFIKALGVPFVPFAWLG